MEAEDEFVNEIIEEVLAEEKELEKKHQEIIANGCPHSEKKNHKGIFSGIEFKFCVVCNMQFDLEDNPI